jgi:hypothetical protein
MSNDLRECWEDLGLELPEPERAAVRACFLGLLKSYMADRQAREGLIGRMAFPIIRRVFPRLPPWHQPLRRNIDYQAVGRKTFLVMPDSLETPCGKKSEKP